MRGFSRSFWLATLATALYFFSIEMTFPIVPIFITDELGASETLVGTSVLVTAMVSLMLRIPAGAWSDRFGRRPFMLLGAALGIVYPISMALSSTIALFMLSRVIFGVTLAFFTTALKAYIADIVPPERRGEAFGINSSAFSLALIFGPLSGEAIKGEFGFRPAFLAGSVLAFASLMVILRLRDEETRPTTGNSMFSDIGQVLRRRGSWASIFTGLSVSGAFAMIFVFFPIYADEKNFKADAPAFMQNIIVSLGFSLFAIITLVMLSRAGRFSDVRGRTLALIPGVVIALPGIILLWQAGNLWVAYAAIGIVAFGFSFGRAIMDALMQDACPPELRGTGTAVLFSAWDVAIGIESQFLGSAIDIAGFGAMYVIVALSLVVFGGVSIMLSHQVSRERITTYKAEFPPLPTR